MAREFVLGILDEENGVYGISFPDFPGCVGGGNTIAEAEVSAAQALALHVEGMIEDGEALPVITKGWMNEAIKRKFKGKTAIAIPLTLPSKSVRINLSIEEGLLAEIDRVAENRSEFIAEAAREKLRKAG